MKPLRKPEIEAKIVDYALDYILSPENVSKVAKDMVSYYNASIDNNAEIKILEDFINDHRQEAEQLAEGHPDGNRQQIRG